MPLRPTASLPNTPIVNQELGSTEFDTGNRTLTLSDSDDQAWLETTELDLFKLPVIDDVTLDPAGTETYKIGKGLDFPRARLVRYERTSPGEILYEAEGYDNADYLASIVRPKVFSWRLRDDRVRLLNR